MTGGEKTVEKRSEILSYDNIGVTHILYPLLFMLMSVIPLVSYSPSYVCFKQ